MQLFIKHPSTGQTLVFSCEPTTTLHGLLEWIEDKTGWPSKFYYLVHQGRPIDILTEGQQSKTFYELKISKEDTIHVVGRLIG